MEIVQCRSLGRNALALRPIHIVNLLGVKAVEISRDVGHIT